MRLRLAALVVALAVVGAVVGIAHAQGVDPRSGGVEIVLGEWTVVPEAKAIRPGEVTFRVVNRGRFGHGFRIRSAGSGGDGRLEARTRVLAPGESATLTVDLPAGTYDIECFVEDVHGDHEGRGMHATLVVRADAPLVKPATAAPASRKAVAIRGFAFQPATIRVKAGETVRWTNADAAPHTVTASNGSFTSKTLAQRGIFTRRFAKAGTYAYVCALHPQMRGRVIVG